MIIEETYQGMRVDRFLAQDEFNPQERKGFWQTEEEKRRKQKILLEALDSEEEMPD